MEITQGQISGDEIFEERWGSEISERETLGRHIWGEKNGEDELEERILGDILTTVYRCLSPFKIGIHISLEQSV